MISIMKHFTDEKTMKSAFDVQWNQREKIWVVLLELKSKIKSFCLNFVSSSAQIA